MECDEAAVNRDEFQPSADELCFWPLAVLALFSGFISIQIRKAELGDADVIAEFNLRLAQETEHLRLDATTVHAGVRALLRDPAKGLYFVAVTTEGIVGQVMITYEWSDWRNGNLWWLQSVYVRKEYRGQGVFRRLFAHLEQLARSDGGVAALRLYMHAENSRARQSYSKLGMEQTQYQVFEKALK